MTATLTTHRNVSEKIYQQCCEVIPGGVNSPARAAGGMINPPMIASHATGDKIFDADGNSYIDFCCSWGAMIHGHANPDILSHVVKRMSMGSSFGVTCEVEEKLARKIVNSIDSIDKVRFVNSGTEATMTAARVARGYTGRKLIVKFVGNYHGHADFFLHEAGSALIGLSPTSSSDGIPEEILKDTVSLPYNNIEACRQLFENPTFSERIAGVILEPIAGNMGVVPASQQFIDYLREATEKMGALLIFDEVITGFRVGFKGAQEIYGVQPDITTLGKIIGAGFPLAAIGGRKDVMDSLAPIGKVFQAGTLSGNPVAVEAGYQALRKLEVDGVYEELERKTLSIVRPIQEFIASKGIKACVQQVGSMFTLFFGVTSMNNMQDASQLDKEEFVKFFKAMFEQGIYIPPSQYEAWFVSTAHTDENLATARDAILGYLNTLV